MLATGLSGLMIATGLSGVYYVCIIVCLVFAFLIVPLRTSKIRVLSRQGRIPMQPLPSCRLITRTAKPNIPRERENTRIVGKESNMLHCFYQIYVTRYSITIVTV